MYINNDNHTDAICEKAVLSTIIKNGFSVLAEISDISISPDSFGNEYNQSVFSSLKKIFDKDQETKVDAPLIISTSKELGLHDFTRDKDAANHLRSIIALPSEKENIRKYAAKIKKLHIYRDYILKLKSIENHINKCNGSEKLSDVLTFAEGEILDFGRGLSDDDGMVLLGDCARSYIDKLIATAKPMGIQTGFPYFDLSIGGGLMPNSFDVIGARIKTGKSLIKNAMMLNIAKQGIPVLDIDTEMTREEQIRRLVSAESKIKERRIRDGLIKGNPAEMKAVEAAADSFKDLPIYHECVAEKNIEQIVATIRRWILTKVGVDANGAAKPCVVFLDYLKITQSGDFDGDMKEYQTMGMMATKIKNLMAKYSARCVAFVQLNRDGIDKEDESAIAQSDRIAWFCTSFSILKWLNAEEIANANEPKFTHKLIPVLSRHGGRWQTGNFIYIESNTACCYMKEGPTIEDARNTAQPF